jgi:hypothetical protein
MCGNHLQLVNSNQPISNLDQSAHRSLAVWSESLHDKIIRIDWLKYNPNSSNQATANINN